MNNMQQRVYRPPNVAGWEGGMSWLNTNTVQGRFDMVTRAQYLKYSNYYRNTETPTRRSVNCPADVVGRDRRRPRTSAPTRPSTARGSRTRRSDKLTRLRGHADGQPTGPRRSGAPTRFYALQAMMLGGPDGQVM